CLNDQGSCPESLLCRLCIYSPEPLLYPCDTWAVSKSTGNSTGICIRWEAEISPHRSGHSGTSDIRLSQGNTAAGFHCAVPFVKSTIQSHLRPGPGFLWRFY